MPQIVKIKVMTQEQEQKVDKLNKQLRAKLKQIKNPLLFKIIDEYLVLSALQTTQGEDDIDFFITSQTIVLEYLATAK